MRQTPRVNEAALAVTARADDVVRRAVQLMLEAAPSYAGTLDWRARQLCEEDAGRHLRALVGSVVAAEPKIFTDYAAWAAELRSPTGIAVEHLGALYAATGRAIAELAPSAVSVVEPHLEAGERALSR
jgi:hypothetical protein